MVLDVEVDVDGPGHVKFSDHDTMINNLHFKSIRIHQNIFLNKGLCYLVEFCRKAVWLLCFFRDKCKNN